MIGSIPDVRVTCRAMASYTLWRRGPIKSTYTLHVVYLGGSGGMLPQENFAKVEVASEGPQTLLYTYVLHVLANEKNGTFCNRTLLRLAVFRMAVGHLHESY